MLSLLGLLSPLLALLDKLFGYVADTKKAEVEAEASVGVAATQATASVERRWWFVAATIPLFALPYIVYTWKAVAWDKVIGPWLGYHSSTDRIDGTLGQIFLVIVTGLFLQAGIRMFK